MSLSDDAESPGRYRLGRAANRPPSGSPPGLFFKLAAATGGLFVVTIFISIALLSGDPRSAVNQWLDRWMTTLLWTEVIFLVCCSVVGMVRDQRTSPRHRSAKVASEASGSESPEFTRRTN